MANISEMSQGRVVMIDPTKRHYQQYEMETRLFGHVIEFAQYEDKRNEVLVKVRFQNGHLGVYPPDVLMVV